MVEIGDLMNTRIIASFLDMNQKGHGYLTVSSFNNVVRQIIDDTDEDHLADSSEYFSLNRLSDKYTCDNADWYSICDQMDDWPVIVSAMINKGKLKYFMKDEANIDTMVVMELLGTTVIFNCLDGLVGMLIHKSDIDQFVKDANSSR
jgi:hypothetical protein